MVVLVMDDRVWFESGSLCDYLLGLQGQAAALVGVAEDEGDDRRLLAAGSVEDALGQVRDGLILTALEAAMTIADRRRRG